MSTPTDFRPLNFTEKAQYFALDAMGDIGLGKPFGYLTENRDMHSYIEINMSSLPILNFLSAMPWLASILYRWPLRLALPKEGDQVGFGRLMGWATSSKS